MQGLNKLYYKRKLSGKNKYSCPMFVLQLGINFLLILTPLSY